MKGLAGQAFTVLFGRGVIRVAQLIAFLVLAKALSPTDFGWYGILTSAVALAASLGSLGLRQSFAYEIGNGRLSAGRAVGTGLVIWPLATAASALIIFLLYGRSVDGIPQTQLAAIIVAGVAGAILVALMQGIFLGRGTIWAFSLSEAVPQVVLMVGVVLLALTTVLTLNASLWLQASGFLLAAVVSVAIVVRGQERLGVALHRIVPMLKYGLVFALNVFMIMLSTRLAMFVIEANFGPEEAGQFFAAVRISEIFLEAAAAVGMVLFSRAAQNSDSHSSVRDGAVIASWMFWFFLVIGGLVALVSPYLVGVLLGPEYSPAVPALQVLALSMAPTAASRIIYPSVAGSGRPSFGTPMIFASLTINGLLALALVPVFGIIGGAMALVVGQFVLYLGYALMCRSRFGVSVRSLLLPDVGALLKLRANRKNRKRRFKHGQSDTEEIHDDDE